MHFEEFQAHGVIQRQGGGHPKGKALRVKGHFDRHHLVVPCLHFVLDAAHQEALLHGGDEALHQRIKTIDLLTGTMQVIPIQHC